mmetsp:Transcript_25158/g.74804  ORF Transcript_25158/g.74804 Transcript_25158/m.74804 type:complete len:260 (-) Transcript_25158:374-1153(-)
MRHVPHAALLPGALRRRLVRHSRPARALRHHHLLLRRAAPRRGPVLHLPRPLAEHRLHGPVDRPLHLSAHPGPRPLLVRVLHLRADGDAIRRLLRRRRPHPGVDLVDAVRVLHVLGLQRHGDQRVWRPRGRLRPGWRRRVWRRVPLLGRRGDPRARLRRALRRPLRSHADHHRPRSARGGLPLPPTQHHAGRLIARPRALARPRASHSKSLHWVFSEIGDAPCRRAPCYFFRHPSKVRAAKLAPGILAPVSLSSIGFIF